ncbi:MULTISPECIES: hypothetical protein [Bacillus]|uniref:hypothetical protein n=1 Tax=Bacillus TaxID=1386 RepID=UPI00098AFE5E|nr:MULTISPECIES: hypothetical protein [Bacillus]WFA07135.1 hypothetical protein P3X63_10375 [Bacillus sp. HSf4]
MASGKSTIAQMLSEPFEESVHVRGDLFRKMIVKGNIDMSPDDATGAEEQLQLRYAIAANVAEMYDRAGFALSCRTIYLGKAVHPFLKRFTEKPLYLITLNPNSAAMAGEAKQARLLHLGNRTSL